LAVLTSSSDTPPADSPTLQSPDAGLAAEALAGSFPALMVAAQRVAETVAAGTHGRRRVGSGESFWQFRPYQTGDDVDRIDWRQSAKGDRLYIRETEWAAAQTVWLWRDARPGMGYASRRGGETKRARAELLLLALSALLLRGGERVALLGGGREPSTGRGVLHAMLAELGIHHPLAAVNRAVPRHASLILLSDFLGPVDELARDLDRVAATGAAAWLIQILDPAEIAFPFQGRVRYREMGQGAVDGDGDVLVPRSESIREDYLDALHRHQEALRSFARGRGWELLVHSTGAPPEEPLRHLHVRLGQRIGDGAGVRP
jgi:uncharacterized protein (DUF58 family)